MPISPRTPGREPIDPDEVRGILAGYERHPDSYEGLEDEVERLRKIEAAAGPALAALDREFYAAHEEVRNALRVALRRQPVEGDGASEVDSMPEGGNSFVRNLALTDDEHAMVVGSLSVLMLDEEAAQVRASLVAKLLGLEAEVERLRAIEAAAREVLATFGHAEFVSINKLRAALSEPAADESERNRV